MRNLILLRGAMCSGKSSWIKENKLEQYTLCADEIRLLFQSPVLNNYGYLEISQKNDKKVWELLFKLLEERMERGEFTIIDATHSRIDMLTRYKKLAEKYRYRLQVIEFKEELDTLLERNKLREKYKQVPEEIIKNAYTRIETQETPGYCEIIKKEYFSKFLNIKKDLSNYEKIICIGDIHGCFEPINEYFKNNPFNKNYFYIFLGDYIDRGIQNYEVLTYLDNLTNENKNVLLLEGNHEYWIRKHGFYNREDFKEQIKSKEFLNNTLIEIEKKGWNQSNSRSFYRKIGQFAYFDYNGKTILITHGGLSNLPTIFTSTEEMVKGVGKYEDSLEIDKSFVKNTSDNTIQIHGHRNIYDEPIKTTERTFNLCDKIEFGGFLRILEIDKSFKINEIKIKNNLFNKDLLIRENEKQIDSLNDEQIIKKLLLSNDLIKKQCSGDIYSFNFNRNVFRDKKWNQITTKARGLFIDIEKNKIVARSYEKFFNLDEREETKLPNLKKINFPIIGYRKENGYLGILSYYNDNWFIASKSTTDGDFAGWFKQILEEKKILTNDLKEYILKNNVSLVFEVIDTKNDPHIIEYSNNELILLDVIKNEFNFSKLPYSELINFSKEYSIKVKEKEIEFNCFEEFEKWYKEVEKDYNFIKHEGYVFENNKNFMFKFKSNYYNTWKNMRFVLQAISKGHIVKLSTLRTKIENEFYSFIKQKTVEELVNKSIIDFRKEYEQNIKI